MSDKFQGSEAKDPVSTRTLRALREITGRLLSALLPRRGAAAEPQNRSWARRIASPSEIPEEYRGFFDALPEEQKHPFPYAVLTPTFKGIGRGGESQKLVFATDQGIYVLEAKGDSLASACYTPERICLVERGTILLYSWITVHGRVEGKIASTTLGFNTVTDHLLAPFLERMRPPTAGGQDSEPSEQRARFNHLAQANFKFMSYGQASIRPGAEVLGILLQPEIRRERFQILGISVERRVSTAHLVILTDSEFIVIRDDDTQGWIKGTPHGAIWTYIPRKDIVTTSLNPRDDGLLALSIEVTGELRVQSLFETRRRGDLDQLLNQLHARAA